MWSTRFDGSIRGLRCAPWCGRCCRWCRQCADDPLAEWLVDGCWDRNFGFDYQDEDYEPPWEPFSCSLPTVCDPISIHLQTGQEPTTEQEAAVDASARCMLEALRDGTSAVHSVSWSTNGGQYSTNLAYYVLSGGIVGSQNGFEDLGGGFDETYRHTRDDAFFDECLGQSQSPLGCVLGSDFPPLDREACIDDVPSCP